LKQVTEPEQSKETMEHIIQRNPNSVIVQLTFVGEGAEQPLITNIIRNYDVDVNILQGKISHTQNGPYGTLVIQVDGKREEVEKAVNFIKEQQVKVEVMEK
jgi:D-methionine transport system ATP-binding protein